MINEAGLEKFFNEWLRRSSGLEDQSNRLAPSDATPPPIRQPSYDAAMYTAAIRRGNVSDDASPDRVVEGQFFPPAYDEVWKLITASAFIHQHDCLEEEAIVNQIHTADPVARPSQYTRSRGEAVGLLDPQTAIGQRYTILDCLLKRAHRLSGILL
jgi:hypothetical protein